MQVQEASGRIEEFFGRAFGELPEIRGKSYRAFLDILYKMYPEKPLEKRILIAEQNMEEVNAIYYQKLHVILLPEDAKPRSLIHELVHAYTRNHWPEVFAPDDYERETVLAGKMLTEGLAEYTVVKTCPEAKRYGALLMWCTGKPFFGALKERHVQRTFEELKATLFAKNFKVDEHVYNLGALAVAGVLEEEEDKHAAFGRLVKNMPRKIDAVRSIIDPKAYKYFMRTGK